MTPFIYFDYFVFFSRLLPCPDRFSAALQGEWRGDLLDRGHQGAAVAPPPGGAGELCALLFPAARVWRSR